MREVRLLLTCVGGRFSRSTIKALKSCQDLSIKIVGVDAQETPAAKDEVDSFYTVPMGTAQNYIPEILEICRKEKVDIVIPCSDEEALAVSESKNDFTKKSISCAVDTLSNVFRVQDTLGLLDYLKINNIHTPKYELVCTAQEVEDFARNVGYPEKKFVLKPPVGRGARGVWVIDENAAGSGLRDFKERTKQLTWCNYLAMEYLPGDAYDVDVLAKNGTPLCIVPRKREWENRLSPSSEGCIVQGTSMLQAYVLNITKLMNLNYAYDFDCGTGEDGKPAIYEINPRFSGAVAAGIGAGVNIPCMLVKMMLGMEIGDFTIKYGTRMRPAQNGDMEFSYEEGAYADQNS